MVVSDGKEATKKEMARSMIIAASWLRKDWKMKRCGWRLLHPICVYAAFVLQFTRRFLGFFSGHIGVQDRPPAKLDILRRQGNGLATMPRLIVEWGSLVRSRVLS